MTLAEAKVKTRKLIDEYSINGVVTSEDNKTLKDYIYKMPDAFDTAQKEIATVQPIRKIHKISQNNPVNALGEQFAIRSHTTDLTYETTNAKAYYFAVDDVATVYVEYEYPAGTYTVLETIENETVGNFTSYKGLISAPSNSLSVRLRFSGDYYYNICNVALFNYSFSSDSRIPDYQKYSLYVMPTDFYKLTKVIVKSDSIYTKYDEYFWENPKTLAVPYSLVGEFSIEYCAMPTTITATTADTYEFQVSAEAQEAIPYYAAAICIQNEDDKSGVFQSLFQMYQGKLMNLQPNKAPTATTIRNTFFRGTRF